MRTAWHCFGLLFAFLTTFSLAAETKTQPVRMGCGLMTFDTVPG